MWTNRNRKHRKYCFTSYQSYLTLEHMYQEQFCAVSFYFFSLFDDLCTAGLQICLLPAFVPHHVINILKDVSFGADNPPACRRPPSHWYSTLRPHNAGAPSATLATGTPASRLQGGHVRPSVAVWHFADVLSRRLPSCRRCS